MTQNSLNQNDPMIIALNGFKAIEQSELEKFHNCEASISAIKFAAHLMSLTSEETVEYIADLPKEDHFGQLCNSNEWINECRALLTRAQVKLMAAHWALKLLQEQESKKVFENLESELRAKYSLEGTDDDAC